MEGELHGASQRPAMVILNESCSHCIIIANTVHPSQAMPIPPETMQTLLLLCIIGCALLAMLYLRERRLTVLAYALWGLLALCLPLLGPMLVIAARPGKSHR